MKTKTEKNSVGIVMAIVCILLVAGIVYTYIDGNKAKTELDLVPCWTEMCEDKDVQNVDSATIITKAYKFKNEKVVISKTTFKESNILPISMIKEIVDPSIRTLIEEDSFGTSVAYIETGMYDSDGSEIYTAKQGTKPSWLEE